MANTSVFQTDNAGSIPVIPSIRSSTFFGKWGSFFLADVPLSGTGCCVAELLTVGGVCGVEKWVAV